MGEVFGWGRACGHAGQGRAQAMSQGCATDGLGGDCTGILSASMRAQCPSLLLAGVGEAEGRQGAYRQRMLAFVSLRGPSAA